MTELVLAKFCMSNFRSEAQRGRRFPRLENGPFKVGLALLRGLPRVWRRLFGAKLSLRTQLPRGCLVFWQSTSGPGR